MPTFGPKSLVVRAISFQHGATNSVVWNCFATFLSDAMKPNVGVIGAIALINPAVAAPVIALAVVCGVFRVLHSKREAADEARIHQATLDLAKRSASVADTLADWASGKQPCPFGLDDQAKADVAAAVDALAAKPGSAVRQAVGDEFERLLSEHATLKQLETVVKSFPEFEETVRILLWTQHHRGKDQDRKLDDHGRTLKDIWRMLTERNPAAASLRRDPDDLLSRVEQACKAKFRRQDEPSVARLYDAVWGGEYLRVCSIEGEGSSQFPVAVTEQTLTEGTVDRFHAAVLARYKDDDSGTRGYLVCRAGPVDPALKKHARNLGIFVNTFVEFQNMVTLDGYVASQSARLLGARGYDPQHYVDQRISWAGMPNGVPAEDAIEQIFDWLRREDRLFILVLGNFGTGKSFLTKRLACLIPERLPDFKPLHIDMKELEKAHALPGWLAAHLQENGLNEVNRAKIEYMIREGRIVLLVDGFDELAVRITYPAAAERLATLTAALQGRAKIIVTSRTQHFETDGQVNEHLESKLPDASHRVKASLHEFDPDRIKAFLVKRLGNPEDAENRKKLLDEVTHLAKLAENPRMLSYIMEISGEELQAARAKFGTVTKSKLYGMLVDKWLVYETTRKDHRSAEPALNRAQLEATVAKLAHVAWRSEKGVVTHDDIRTVLRDASVAQSAAPGAKPPAAINIEDAVQQAGSGSFLVNQGERQMVFSHQSIAEWFLAREAATALNDHDDVTALEELPMSDLLAEFFCEMADTAKVSAWAQAVGASTFEGKIAFQNTAHIVKWLGITLRRAANFVDHKQTPIDLRLYKLVGADATRADLEGIIGIEIDATGSVWKDAKLRRANFRGAVFRNADLSGADLSGANLMKADLSGATLTGTVLRRSKMLGAVVDPGALSSLDTFGAAMPLAALDSAKAFFDTFVERSESRVQSVAFVPRPPTAGEGGDVLATGHVDGTVLLWDVSTGKVLRTLAGHTGVVWSVSFAPDGQLLATGSADYTARLWEASTGKALRTLEGHAGDVLSVSFARDGKTLATSSIDNTARLWEVTTGKALRTLKGHTGPVSGVSFSPDGQVLATGSGDKTARLWDVSTGKMFRTLEGHTDDVRSVSFAPDGKVVATGSDDRTSRLWEASTGRALRTLEGHTRVVWSVCFAPDGTLLATGSQDNSVRLWDASTGETLRTLQGHTDDVRSVSFAPDGQLLATGSADNTARLWEASTGKARRTLEGHAGFIWSVSFAPDGMVLATGADDQTGRLWNPSTGKELRTLRGHKGDVLSLSFASEGKVLATGSGDKTARLWDVSTGKALRTLGGHTDYVRSVSFDPDGHVLATGSDDHTACLWEVSTGKVLRVIKGHTDWVWSVCFAPDGKMLATGSDDKTARLWNASTGEEIRTLKGHADWVRSVSFGPDGKVLATGSCDMTARLWDASTGKVLRTLTGHKDWVWSVSFSPDAKVLATGSGDTTARLWEVSTGKTLRTLEGHTGSVMSVSFAPDGKVLATGSVDKTARLWEVSSGRCMAVLVPTIGGWVAYSPDGRYKFGGEVAGQFWHAINLCRFEVGELDDVFPIRMKDDEPFK